nr:hypothetical protein [Mucilaginibacter sp. X5P1]
MPCHHTRPPLFCLLSPEAVLLTRKKEKKKAQALTTRGRASVEAGMTV